MACFSTFPKHITSVFGEVILFNGWVIFTRDHLMLKGLFTLQYSVIVKEKDRVQSERVVTGKEKKDTVEKLMIRKHFLNVQWGFTIRKSSMIINFRIDLLKQSSYDNKKKIEMKRKGLLKQELIRKYDMKWSINSGMQFSDFILFFCWCIFNRYCFSK